jgi:transforming growth factor-beta-induced protein
MRRLLPCQPVPSTTCSKIFDLLAGVLLYHGAAGKTLSTDLVDGMLIPALDGNNLIVRINDKLTINDATVVAADATALNGVMHKIDQVLIPPGLELPPNIYQTAAEEDFDTLVTAIDAAGLVDALAADIFTVFAPTDEAFASLPVGALDYLLANIDALTEVLLYHDIAGEILAADLSNGRIPTIDGANSVTIAIADGSAPVDGVTVEDADIAALNGVIHAIDQVLLPPGFSLPGNTVEAVDAYPKLLILGAALLATDLADDLVDSILTVFAPIDAAFDALPGGVLGYLLETLIS